MQILIAFQKQMPCLADICFWIILKLFELFLVILGKLTYNHFKKWDGTVIFIYIYYMWGNVLNFLYTLLF